MPGILRSPAFRNPSAVRARPAQHTSAKPSAENKLDAVLIKEGAAPLITTESMRVRERVCIVSLIIGPN